MLVLAMGPLITVLVAVVALGVLAWLISLTPIPPPFKTAAYVVLCIVLFVLVLRFVIHEFPELGSL
jgi:hypothetical protein